MSKIHRVRLALALVIGLLSITPSATGRESARGHGVHVNDIDLYYEELGAGKPLVLLHGFGGCGQAWQPFTEQLAKHHRLIIVDLRGHGHSTNPGNTFTHRQAASDVLALLDSLGIEQFEAMGISSGGMTLLHMATRQPARIESMVLVSASPYFPQAARSILRDASLDNMPPEVQKMFRSCATRGEAQVRQLVAQFQGFHKSYDDMNFTAPYLSTISARTLIVHGDRDPFFPVEIPLSLYRAIPHASLWIVAGGDHVPIFDPDVHFAETALKFIDGSDASGQE
jgi:pimeloyl-ACP methyl ester carboxylesterase